MVAPILLASTTAAQPVPARVTQAAEDFTATSLAALLAPMFDTLDPQGGFFGGGAGEAAFRPMLVQQYAASIARQGGLGLTASVTQALLRLQEKNS
jgi:Rod binding domain-containing protein